MQNPTRHVCTQIEETNIGIRKPKPKAKYILKNVGGQKVMGNEKKMAKIYSFSNGITCVR